MRKYKECLLDPEVSVEERFALLWEELERAYSIMSVLEKRIHELERRLKMYDDEKKMYVGGGQVI